jgi:hypothetical protein
MTTKTTSNRGRGLIVAAVIAVAGGAGAAAWAQTAAVENPGVTIPANVLSVGDIESRLAAQGIKVKEIEVRDLLAEVEGWDAQGREIELTIDRRNGETLAHEYDR